MQLSVTEPDRPLPPEYEWLIGPHAGILEGINLWFPERGGPNVLTSGMRETDIGQLLGEETSGLTAGGKGRTAAEALRTTVGEAVERYCRRWVDETALITTSHRSLSEDRRVPSLDYFAVFPGNESAVESTDRDTDLPWTAGVNLLTGETTYVPAELVWSTDGPLSDEPRRFAGTSSGTAAGPTLMDAVVGGLYEVIERDGFTRVWHADQSPPRVSPQEAPKLGDLQDELFGMPSYTPAVFEFDPAVDLPTYGAALVNDSDEYPKFLLGGSTAVSAWEAVEDALIEIGQGWISIHESAEERKTKQLSADDWIGNFEDNVTLYAKPDQFDAVSYLLDGPAVGVPTMDPDNGELSTVLAALERADCTPIAVDITTPDVAHSGIRVVSVVVPELLPLTPPSLVPSEHPEADDLSLKHSPHPFP